MLAVVISVIFCTVLGMVIEKVAYSPLRKASSNLAVLITAIGVSYLLQNLALLIFGADAKSFVTVVDVPSVSLFDGQLTIKGITIVTIIACIVIMVGLMLFVQKTKPGQCHAGCFRRQRCSTADGSQCQCHNFHDICNWFRTCCHCRTFFSVRPIRH